MRRLTLSLPDELLEETDKFARRSRQSRSGFVQTVLADYMRGQRRRTLERKLAEEYRELAQESLAQSRAFSGLEEEALELQAGGTGDGLDW